MPSIPAAAIGAIIAATIAGVISLLGLIIAKEQKVSDFRQTWIDELRQDLAAFLGHMGVMIAVIAEYTRSATVVDIRSLAELLRDDLGEAVRRISSIRLRLNPKESTDMLRLLNEFEALFTASKPPTAAELDALEKKLVALAQPLLKKEWERVKTGEPVFRLARAIAVIVVLGGLALLSMEVVRSL